MLAGLPIRRLELWLLSLPLRDLGPLTGVLSALDLEELTLSVSHCPDLAPASVRELRAAARHLKWRQGSKLTMWLDLQDIRLDCGLERRENKLLTTGRRCETILHGPSVARSPLQSSTLSIYASSLLFRCDIGGLALRGSMSTAG